VRVERAAEARGRVLVAERLLCGERQPEWRHQLVAVAAARGHSDELLGEQRVLGVARVGVIEDLAQLPVGIVDAPGGDER
jgi:hypothetical protein